MGRPSVILFICLLSLCLGSPAAAKTGFHDLQVNSALDVTTVTGVTLPSYFGPPDHYYAAFKMWPVVPGERYEATLTYDAGTDIGYATAWIDGDPSTREAQSFVGIGTGTGSRALKGKEEKFLFSVDPGSTSNVLYVLVRSHKPLHIRFAVTDSPSGVTNRSQDKWGYYYVKDFDADKNAPFLLKRGGIMTAAAGPASVSQPRLWGPFAFLTNSMRGTLMIVQFSDSQGIAWLNVEGTGIEEILNVAFSGGDVRFSRVVDCRFGRLQAVTQNFTGNLLPDGSIQGGYTSSDQPAAINPWQAQK